ncbi:hypothetical protein DFA_04969 [Cavenderia fasciculata]|uniref:IPT/TIG domain-containing protein n=1 Tax=Cavenderia fasciculata TaxID=261658 RepID=F4PMP2_CACFS|nr:uncharacterized protein DFA_04969 [Cavenderia fasciculata]EGG22839.1 hypothetical protein DFA_04969 [Cavenderia fasciculata]|eukprot:XP_004360690.1 hypothetical protein DFA_04969 [Cavenderia fasciculata]
MYKSQFLLLVAACLLFYSSSSVIAQTQPSSYTLSSLSFDYNQTITATGYFGDESSLVSILVDQYAGCQVTQFTSTSLNCTTSHVINPHHHQSDDGNKTVTVIIKVGDTILNGTLFLDDNDNNNNNNNNTDYYYISNVAYNNRDLSIILSGHFDDTDYDTVNSTLVTVETIDLRVECNVTAINTTSIYCQLLGNYRQRILQPNTTYDISVMGKLFNLTSTLLFNYNISSLTFDADIQTISATGYFGEYGGFISVYDDQKTSCRITKFNSSNLNFIIHPNEPGIMTISISINSATLIASLEIKNTTNFYIASARYNNMTNSINITGQFPNYSYYYSYADYYTYFGGAIYVFVTVDYTDYPLTNGEKLPIQLFMYPCHISAFTNQSVDCEFKSHLRPYNATYPLSIHLYSGTDRSYVTVLNSTIDITPHYYHLYSEFDNVKAEINSIGYFGFDPTVVSVLVGNDNTPCSIIDFNSTNIKCTLLPRPTGIRLTNITIRVNDIVLKESLPVNETYIVYIDYYVTSTIYITPKVYALTRVSFDDAQIINARGFFGNDSSKVSIWIDEYTPCPIVSFSDTNINCIINPRPTSSELNIAIRINDNMNDTTTTTILNGTVFIDNTNYHISRVVYNDTQNTLKIFGHLANTTVENTTIQIKPSPSWSDYTYSCIVTAVNTGFVDCRLSEYSPSRYPCNVSISSSSFNNDLKSITTLSTNDRYYYYTFFATPMRLRIDGNFGESPSDAANVSVELVLFRKSGISYIDCPIYYFSPNYLLCSRPVNIPLINYEDYLVNTIVNNIIINSYVDMYRPYSGLS